MSLRTRGVKILSKVDASTNDEESERLFAELFGRPYDPTDPILPSMASLTDAAADGPRTSAERRDAKALKRARPGKRFKVNRKDDFDEHIHFPSSRGRAGALDEEAQAKALRRERKINRREEKRDLTRFDAVDPFAGEEVTTLKPGKGGEVVVETSRQGKVVTRNVVERGGAASGSAPSTGAAPAGSGPGDGAASGSASSSGPASAPLSGSGFGLANGAASRSASSSDPGSGSRPGSGFGLSKGRGAGFGLRGGKRDFSTFTRPRIGLDLAGGFD